MHLQSPVPGWTEALVAMPDGALLKAFSPSTLREGKEKWAAAGRDPAKLITCLRHFDVQSAPAGSWESVKAHWRAMFARFVDATYLRDFAPFVDIVSEANEYTATSTWQDATDKARALMSVRGAVAVWNGEYRGKVVSAHTRLALLSGPVSNDIPREVLELAVAEDCPIDYHAYTRWQNKQRYANDWQDDSGRWHFIEQRDGLKPDWLFGECGPYIDAAGGWRRADVLGGDVALLVEAMRRWVRDVATTPACREGRILGPGAWFTSGGQGWPYYELETGQLLPIAQMMAAEWRPGVKDVDAELKAKINEQVQVIDTASANIKRLLGVTVNWWETWPAGVISPPRKLKVTGRTITIYKADGATVITTRVQSGEWDVFYRSGALLKVYDPAGDAGDWWVRGQDVEPKA